MECDLWNFSSSVFYFYFYFYKIGWMEQERQQGVLGGILEEGTILVISCISLSIHAFKLSKVILKHMLEMATGPWHNDVVYIYFFLALGLVVIFSYLSKAITFKLFTIKLVTVEFPHSVLDLFFSNRTKCEWRCQIFRTTKPSINDLPNCSMSLALLVYEPFLMQPMLLLKKNIYATCAIIKRYICLNVGKNVMHKH